MARIGRSRRSSIGSDAVAQQFQGWGVALSGDGNTAVVGSGGGGLWVFTRTGTSWTQQGPKLTGTAGDAQANGVAISQDGSTILTCGTQGAWVFTQIDGVWGQQGPTLSVPNSSAAVSLSADGNTAAIGAPGSSQFGAGASYIFRRSVATWTQQATLNVTNDFLQQGNSVSLSSDGNTLWVGSNNTQSGLSYVYTYANSTWSLFGRLFPSDRNGATNIGSAVAVSGDGLAALMGGPGLPGAFGYVWQWLAHTPTIAVVQPPGSNITNNGTASMGTFVIGNTAPSITFTIKNIGIGDLHDLTTTIHGADAALFSVTAAPTAPVPAGGSTNFTVLFAPTAATSRNRTGEPAYRERHLRGKLI